LALNTEVLSRPIVVLGNSSRFFSTRREALRQPTGIVELAWRSKDPYLFNAGFDSSLISHDDAYCTSVVDINQVTQVPTLTYVRERVLSHLAAEAHVVDIGCGQGEFVEALRKWGIQAVGFDPVLRRQTPYLHPRYWKPGDSPADLYVMRCVLPHIPDPWSFLREVARSSPGSFVLVEFQRLEWILDEAIWYQISHDHVNLFTVDDFTNRFTVIEHGTFSNGEWGWVLIDPGTIRPAIHRTCGLKSHIDDLLSVRESTLRRAADLDRPIAIWGAAGKGIVLGHALADCGVDDVSVIDADPSRWDLHIEPTGIQVLSPDDAFGHLSERTLILVCNPNHLRDIQGLVDGRWELALPRDVALEDQRTAISGRPRPARGRWRPARR